MGIERETIEERVERMDSHLRQFFDDQQKFITATVGGAEQRLTGRLKKFETEVKAGFKTIDDRLSAHDQRFDGIDRRLDAMDARFDRIDTDLDELKRNVRLLVGRKSARQTKPRR